MNVTLYKAQAVSKRTIEDLVIRAEKVIPNTTTTNGTIEIMRVDAVNLVHALRETLPQGTWSQVVAEVSRVWAADQAGIISAANWVARE
jgi:NaMN:DMB phosphoribosyltransferase